MSIHPSFNEVLKKFIADGYNGLLLDDEPGYARWNKKLREFGERWLNNRDDSELWGGIADNAEKDGLSRETSFYRIAGSSFQALFEGDPANVENFSPKALRLQRDKLLDLARCTQSLADYYRKRVKIFGYAQAADAAQWYEHEAESFRRSAADREANISLVRRGRHQSRGRRFTREHLLFMRSLSGGMCRNFGNPYRKAVAAITNIAHPEAGAIVDEEVRAACKGLPPVERNPIVSDEEAKALGKLFQEGLEVYYGRGSSAPLVTWAGKLEIK